MPNFDAGHYFLTVLAPIRLDAVVIDGQNRSRRHLIREALAGMPTVERTAASQGYGQDVPFARCARTHFARFVVLDDTVFNGRNSGDTLVSAARGIDLLVPQSVDRLSTPFLMFITDFDANSDAPAELQGHLRELWDKMGAELDGVFEHCIGFEAVHSADNFASYIQRCQVETTMPFNDYWCPVPVLPQISFTPYLVAGAAAVILPVIWAWMAHSAWLLLWIIPAVAAVVGALYLGIIRMGQRPFPTSASPAPSSDLPTVLKALYLQREFVDLAIDAQGQDDAALYDAFGGFLKRTNPLDIAAPTQRPGVVGVSAGGTQL